MGAKLISPDGEVQELTMEEYNNLQMMLNRGQRKRRLEATLKKIEDDPDPPSKQWWDEFEQFLKENRVSFPERDLGFAE